MKKVKEVYLLFFFIFSHISSAFPQIQNPVKWDFYISPTTKEGKKNISELVFKANIDKGWHLYSQFIEEGGPIPTSFHFDTSSYYKLIEAVKETGKSESAYDPNFNMKLKWFSNEALFTQKIKILTKEPFTITGYVEFMCCNDMQCLPPKQVDFKFHLNGTSADTIKHIAATKEIIQKSSNDTVNTTSTGGASSTGSGVSSTGVGGISVGGGVSVGGKSSSLWLFFFISILAGFAAVLTPCVFPMIPMTVTFFMQSTAHRAKAKTQALIYGISIILIYTFIGLILAVTLGPSFINWLSTHWLPNILFFALFTIFAASFFGMFEIVLPGWLVNKADKQSDKGGYIGAFFMALTLVLVSFSCTAPLVGGLLVEAARGEVIKPVVGMFGFSLSFALPFTLLAFFPSWLNKLPKSGSWLNSVKVVLGFIILALGMKFLIIPDQTYHWNILTREIYLAIWIVIFTLLGFYLLGKLKLPHDSDLSHITVPRLFLALITFTFVLYLVQGMFGAPLKAISGLLPPFQPSNPPTFQSSNLPIFQSSNLRENICEEPKYADFLHFPLGLHGYFDYEQGLACAKKLNKPILLDFNGHGCANCKDMEANVWSHPEVLQRLRNDFVLISLYVDDKKELPKEEWITSAFDGKVKKTIGEKNADFQVTRFKTNSQPYYVLLDNKGEMLTTPIGRAGVKEFIDFLDRGKKNYIPN
jgi:thiol:disulfide interchange protein DsbD